MRLNKVLAVLVVALLISVALFAVGCNKNNDAPSDEVISLIQEEIAEYKFDDGNIRSVYSLGDKLDLSNTVLYIYLKEDSRYLAYLQEGKGEYELASDEKGSYIQVGISENFVSGFDSSEVKSEAKFTISVLFCSKEYEYSVIDRANVGVEYVLGRGAFAPAEYEDDVRVDTAVNFFPREEGLAYLIGAKRDYYEFDGWLMNGAKVTSLPANLEDESVTLTAAWTPLQYTIKFESEIGEVADIVYTCEEDGGEIALPEMTPSQVGNKVFIGWFKDEEHKEKAEKHNVIPCKDVTYYAGWSSYASIRLDGTFTNMVRSGAKSIDFSKAYFLLEADGEEKRIPVSDKSVVKPEFELNEVGTYSVDFSVTSEGIEYLVPFSYEVFGADVYFVIYETYGGTLPADAPSRFGAEGVETLPVPTLLAHDFLGWYAEATFRTQVTAIPENTVKDVYLYAKFAEHDYFITYYDGADEVYSETYTVTQAKEGKALWQGYEKTGYHFIAWHTSSTITDSNVMINVPAAYGDLKYYAEMGKKVESVTINCESSFDITGSLALAAEVLPVDAYYKTVTYEIVEDKDMTGAYIENGVLYSDIYGTIKIRATADGVESEDFEIKAINNNIESIKILPNEDGDRHVVFAGPENASAVKIELEFGPDKEASLDGHVLYYYFYIDEEENLGANIDDKDIKLSNDIVIYDGNFVGATTITVSNAAYYGKVTVCVELDPEPDPVNVGKYKFNTGKVKGTAVYTIPEPITNVDGLAAIKKDGFYVLQADIDLSEWGGNWEPLCPASTSSGEGLNYDNAFVGYFNGNGHTIENLMIYHKYKDENDIDYGFELAVPTAGLFGAIGSKGVVKNFTLKDVNIRGNFDSNCYVGSVAAAVNMGVVADIKVGGYMEICGGSSVGGVVGRASGILRNLSAGYENAPLEMVLTPVADTAVNNYYYGGVAAYLASGYASELNGNAIVDVEVYSKDNVYFGGAIGYLVGYLSDSTLEGLVLSVKEADAKNGAAALVDIGGAVGYALNPLINVTVGKETSFITISANLATSVKTCIGGIVAESTSNLDGCTVYADFTIENVKQLTLGGVFGSAAGASASICRGSMDIASSSTSAHTIGGIGGKSTASVTGEFVSDSLTFDLKSEFTFGGICADAGSAKAGGKFTVTSFSSSSSGVTFGGIVGKTTGGLMENSESKVTASFTILDAKTVYVGALAGTLSGGAENCETQANILIEANKNATLTVGAFASVDKANVSGVTSNLTLDVASERKTDEGGKEIVAGGATLNAGGIAGKTIGGKTYEIKETTSVFHLTARCLGSSNGAVIAGGIVGDNAVSLIESGTTGDIIVKATKEIDLGGAVGKNQSTGSIVRCNADLSLINTEEYSECVKRVMGGFVGDNAGAVEKCATSVSLKGNTSGSGKKAYVGGFVGINSGSVSVSYVGKFDKDGVRISDDDKAVKIEETTGNDVSVIVGGFVGDNSAVKATISNCYTDAYIVTATTVGGFVGSNSGSISYSLALGKLENVESATKAGAFAYEAKDKSGFTKCLFDDRLGEGILIKTGTVTEDVTGYRTDILTRVNTYDDFDKTLWSVVKDSLPTLIQ